MVIGNEQEWWAAVERLLKNEEALMWLSEYISIEELKEANTKIDHCKVLKLLNHAWWRLPDVPQIHQLPCFHLVCDICSESHVLQGGSNVGS